jgi:putative glycosyltransferase (TIGR04372 family)
MQPAIAQALQKIDNVIGAAVEGQGRQLVYLLVQVDRVGQLAQEIFQIRAIFQGAFDELLLITPPLNERVNREVLRIFTRDARWFPCADTDVLHLGWQDIGAVQQGNRTYALFNPSTLYRLHFETLARGATSQYLTLTAEDEGRGQDLRRALHIPPDAPIVTLHVREAGYLPQLSYHSFRDADIATYVPAIRFLIERGFYVVRLGDRSMRRLAANHAQFIDTPFHPAYQPLVEPYFLWASRFFLGTFSGPYSIARAFNTPTLIANGHIQSIILGGDRDLFAYKKYYSHTLGRMLTYREVVLSPLVDFSKTEEFINYKVQIIDNTPEELWRGTAEMLEQLDGKYTPTAAILNTIHADDQLAHTVRTRAAVAYPYFAPAICQARISEEYLRCNPCLLGHRSEAIL